MPFSSVLQVHLDGQGATQLVTAVGELDRSSVQEIQHAIHGALAKGPETVVLDLSGLTFCDSSGIHLVVHSHRRVTEDGAKFVAVRPTGAAWRPFELCGLDGHVWFVHSQDAAVGS